MSRKGPAFEREISKALSTWWSKKGDDDLFWRTQASGARATQRAKRGKKTRGQSGDICATDGRGRTLMRCFSISLKRGYAKDSIQDIVDKLEGRKEPNLEQWFKECEKHKEENNSISWMLILKKDRRETLVFMPLDLVLFKMNFTRRRQLMECTPNAFICISRAMRKKTIKRIGSQRYLNWFCKNNRIVFCMRFQYFLDLVNRKDIEEIVGNYYGE